MMRADGITRLRSAICSWCNTTLTPSWILFADGFLGVQDAAAKCSRKRDELLAKSTRLKAKLATLQVHDHMLVIYSSSTLLLSISLFRNPWVPFL